MVVRFARMVILAASASRGSSILRVENACNAPLFRNANIVHRKVTVVNAWIIIIRMTESAKFAIISFPNVCNVTRSMNAGPAKMENTSMRTDTVLLVRSWSIVLLVTPILTASPASSLTG